MGKITDNFTEAEIARLRELFLGNEADSDEYRECQPSKTFDFLAALGEDIIDKHLDEIMEALHTWVYDYLADRQGSPDSAYPGAGSWGDIGTLIFDLTIKYRDEHIYWGTDLDAIREDLED